VFDAFHAGRQLVEGDLLADVGFIGLKHVPPNPRYAGLNVAHPQLQFSHVIRDLIYPPANVAQVFQGHAGEFISGHDWRSGERVGLCVSAIVRWYSRTNFSTAGFNGIGIRTVVVVAPVAGLPRPRRLTVVSIVAP